MSYIISKNIKLYYITMQSKKENIEDILDFDDDDHEESKNTNQAKQENIKAGYA